jgi:dUTP pyrophosphatase
MSSPFDIANLECCGNDCGCHDSNIERAIELSKYRNNLLDLKVERMDSFVDFGRSKSLDAAFDLYATEDVIVYHGKVAVVPTGVKVEFNPGWYMQIMGRSGLAMKYGIQVLGGVIDSNYRGEIKVLITSSCTSSEAAYGNGCQYIVKKGDKVAQIIPIRISQDDFSFVDRVNDNEERGEKGFGSSGK